MFGVSGEQRGALAKGGWGGVSANQERVQNFQINFEPLSPESAKPQQLSCCDLILFFCPVTPFSLFSSFFSLLSSRINTSFLSEKLAQNTRRGQEQSYAKRGEPSQNFHLLCEVVCWISFEDFSLFQKHTHTQFHLPTSSLKSDSPFVPET